jgi:stage V sporulation protein G
MKLSEIRVSLCNSAQGANRLRAFCSLTFDHTFVIRDVKLIEGNDGLFLAMPSRKICDHCRRCGEKNHLRARFCNQCGTRLDENRASTFHHAGPGRVKLHADIAHPINIESRHRIEREVLAAYRDELVRSQQPGYVPQVLDADYPMEESRGNEAFPIPIQNRDDVPLRTIGTMA